VKVKLNREDKMATRENAALTGRKAKLRSIHGGRTGKLRRAAAIFHQFKRNEERLVNTIDQQKSKSIEDYTIDENGVKTWSF